MAETIERKTQKKVKPSGAVEGLSPGERSRESGASTLEECTSPP